MESTDSAYIHAKRTQGISPLTLPARALRENPPRQIHPRTLVQSTTPNPNIYVDGATIEVNQVYHQVARVR